MKKYIYLSAAASLFAMVSCSDSFLETEPYTEQVIENFYKTPEDAFQGLVATYDILQREAYGTSLLTSEIASDNCFGGYGIADGQGDLEWDRFLYVTDKDMNAPAWKMGYQGIYRANVLLENLDKVNWGTNTALKTRYEAEARFLRAHYHFQLARMFGDIVALDHTIATGEYQSPRSSAETTYKLIANDLKFAADNLSNDNYSQKGNANFGRITKWAAEAYIARVFLFYTGTYSKADLAGVVSKAQAVSYINDVVNNSGHSLVADYKNLWQAATTASEFAGEDNPEMVFSVRFNGSGNGDWGLHEGNRFQVLIAQRGGNVGNYSTGWGGATVNPKLVNAYSAGDTRKAASFVDYVGEGLSFDPVKREQRQYTGYSWKKYCPVVGEEATGNFQIDNIQDYAIIRFSDVLLMASELNLDSNAGFAQTCLDRVRDRAFKDTAHRVTATKEAIMNERRLELALEGLRYFDLIRQGLDVAKAAIDNTGTTTDFNVTFRKETLGWFPIPQSQIVLSNGAIQQNPGW